FLRGLAALAVWLVPGAAGANPQGGQVAAGSATIATPSTTQTTITQSTSKAVIDWQSFNIAPNEQTIFYQPSSSAMALNRVQVGNPSTIAGQLTANGQIVLVNPSGIVFTKGSQVDVNSLIATPSDISNQNFMAGKLVFDRPPANPNASVVNNGQITIAQKGLAALVAPVVANNGVIQGQLSRVVLGGAATYAIDVYGDGLIKFDVGPQLAVAPNAGSLVSNSGTINAPGGTVLLTADAVSGILNHVIDMSGHINAPTISAAGASVPGNVVIDAGAGNAAQVSGTINV